MTAVVAVYEDFGLGDGVTQPLVLKADRRRFKQLTQWKTIIVGKTTFKDMPAFTDRRVLVLTHDDIPNAIHSIEEAPSDAIICGGESVYKQFFPMIDHVYITLIHAEPESTKFFPSIAGWHIEPTERGKENGISYEFAEAWRV